MVVPKLISKFKKEFIDVEEGEGVEIPNGDFGKCL
jgi:hypothetical protein